MAISGDLRRDVGFLGLPPNTTNELCSALDSISVLSSTEAGYIDGVTAGTVTASKALVVDASKDLATIRGLTMNGTLTHSGATGVNIVAMTDNLADALNFKEGSSSYLKFTTTDSSETITVGVDLTMADAKNIVLNTTTGTKIGTATGQKLGFFNKTPVAQQATTGTSTGFTAGGGTTVTHTSTFTGGTGSAAYTLGDIVLALKNLGLLAA